ncbi:hypothetical protein AX17_005690, partial [Amanita inopinata Kibby_2008]
KYRRGLSPTIEAEIARATGCPTFQDTQGWYNVATQLDRARRAYNAFRGHNALSKPQTWTTAVPTPRAPLPSPHPRTTTTAP